MPKRHCPDKTWHSTSLTNARRYLPFLPWMYHQMLDPLCAIRQHCTKAEFDQHIKIWLEAHADVDNLQTVNRWERMSSSATRARYSRPAVPSFRSGATIVLLTCRLCAALTPLAPRSDAVRAPLEAAPLQEHPGTRRNVVEKTRKAARHGTLSRLTTGLSHALVLEIAWRGSASTHVEKDAARRTPSSCCVQRVPHGWVCSLRGTTSLVMFEPQRVHRPTLPPNRSTMRGAQSRAMAFAASRWLFETGRAPRVSGRNAWGAQLVVERWHWSLV